MPSSARQFYNKCRTLHCVLKMPLVMVFVVSITVVRANLYQECAKLFYPNNYMDHLPSLQLPYMGNVPIPFNVPRVKPSPVVKTKVLSLVTKYVYKNPVCVKYSKKKTTCKQDNPKHKNNLEQLVTKEYFVKDRSKKLGDNDRYQKVDDDDDRRQEDEEDRRQRIQDLDDYEDGGDEDYNDVNLYLQSSEDSRLFVKDNRRTPSLTKHQIHDLLIEDRLDQLETILPHYTRRRVFETSTITITKVISNKRTMATLTVKNCVPQGYEICSPKIRKRLSKVAHFRNNISESHYFG